ncbi:hypothetical protein ACVME8_008027 [Bradyrhizobium diazoefficiens]
MTLPCAIASAFRSKMISVLAAIPMAPVTAPPSAMPLPGAIFSPIAKDRWLDAISVVRSGVTRPRRIDRPASMNSAAITTSTSPGVGISDRIGLRPSSGGIVSI